LGPVLKVGQVGSREAEGALAVRASATLRFRAGGAVSNYGGGDRGMTGLLSGERVRKTDARLEACGSLDELSSVIGVLRAEMSRGSLSDAEVLAQLGLVQGDLLKLGAWAAATGDAGTASVLEELDEGRVGWLERAMTVWECALPPLQCFVLPGGHPTASWAHLARAVCRRAERRVVALEPPPPRAIPYLNRLSSYFFALARWCNHRHGVEETPWRG
jgi:cob(I)alamin adenosyltransferase